MSADYGKFPPERLITPRPAMPQQLTPAAYLLLHRRFRSGGPDDLTLSRPWSDLMLKSYIALQTYLTGLLNRDDRGATAVEYGLIVALIAAVIVVIVATLGGQVSSAFSKVSANM
jgi:pilus assembly protein Flp/PilA